MLLLALDTAGPDCAVALVRGDAASSEVLSRGSERIVRGHAERLMPMATAALADTALDFADLDRIAVTTGPGSFTGVRVGIAAARALALALNVPAVGIDSLAAMIASLVDARRHGSAIALLDARRGEVFARVEDIASGLVLMEPSAMTVAGLAAALRDSARPFVLTGNAAPMLLAALREQDLEMVGTADSPDIEDVARLGMRASSVGLPVPLYARGADAKPQAAKALARA